MSSTYWNTFAQIYRDLAPPLKPSLEDVTVIENALVQRRAQSSRKNLNALMCGVTPALAELTLPTGAQLVAVERSEPMIGGIWPGNTAARTAVRGTALQWPEAAVNTITAYKDKDTRFSFSTIEEIRAALPNSLEETRCRIPSYALGERCPMFILKPRTPIDT